MPNVLSTKLPWKLEKWEVEPKKIVFEFSSVLKSNISNCWTWLYLYFHNIFSWQNTVKYTNNTFTSKQMYMGTVYFIFKKTNNILSLWVHVRSVIFEVFRSCNIVTEDWSHLGCDTSSLDEYFQIFWRIVVPLSSGSSIKQSKNSHVEKMFTYK